MISLQTDGGKVTAKYPKVSAPIIIFVNSKSKRLIQAAVPSGIFLSSPIKRGDLQKHIQACRVPGTFVVCDGLFYSSEAVALREIREATSLGWRLIGLGSIGALRAIEAQPIGMIGVGRVFRWLRLFNVVEDDEIAQAYNAETLEPVSAAMLEIRALIRKLQKLTLINSHEAKRILHSIKHRFFPERSYELVLGLLQDETSTDMLRLKQVEDVISHFISPKEQDLVDFVNSMREGN